VDAVADAVVVAVVATLMEAVVVRGAGAGGGRWAEADNTAFLPFCAPRLLPNFLKDILPLVKDHLMLGCYG
jgi:hypothetical protein